MIEGPGLQRERAMWGCGWGEGGSRGEGGRKIKKSINSKIRMGFTVVFQGGGIKLWHWWGGARMEGNRVDRREVHKKGGQHDDNDGR